MNIQIMVWGKFWQPMQSDIDTITGEDKNPGIPLLGTEFLDTIKKLMLAGF